MPIPKSLEALMDHGVVEQVVRPLRSGKEAEVFLVISEGALRVAKIYKEAHQRTFRNRVTYTEGRRVRNTRDQRAMAKRTGHGKARDEAAWRSTEVDMIYKLRDAGVRVPQPYHFVDGVLIMELVQSASGEPAPRLGELELRAADAKKIYENLLAEVVRMLCAGVVHGDLSEFNVLVGSDGPCIIDFPQSVHAATNANARKLLLRDVGNLHRFLERFHPGRKPQPFGEEMWQLYEKGELAPDTVLTGHYTPPATGGDVDVVMAIIEEAKREERLRQAREGGGAGGYARKKIAALEARAEQGPVAEEPRSPRGKRGPSRGRNPGQGERRPQGDRAAPGNRSAPGNRPAPQGDRAAPGNRRLPGDRRPPGDRPTHGDRRPRGDHASQGERRHGHGHGDRPGPGAHHDRAAHGDHASPGDRPPRSEGPQNAPGTGRGRRRRRPSGGR